MQIYNLCSFYLTLSYKKNRLTIYFFCFCFSRLYFYCFCFLLFIVFYCFLLFIVFIPFINLATAPAAAPPETAPALVQVLASCKSYIVRS